MSFINTDLAEHSTVPIISDILITKKKVWPGSSDKWKVQDDFI